MIEVRNKGVSPVMAMLLGVIACIIVGAAAVAGFGFWAADRDSTWWANAGGMLQGVLGSAVALAGSVVAIVLAQRAVALQEAEARAVLREIVAREVNDVRAVLFVIPQRLNRLVSSITLLETFAGAADLCQEQNEDFSDLTAKIEFLRDLAHADILALADGLEALVSGSAISNRLIKKTAALLDSKFDAARKYRAYRVEDDINLSMITHDVMGIRFNDLVNIAVLLRTFSFELMNFSGKRLQNQHAELTNFIDNLELIARFRPKNFAARSILTAGCMLDYWDARNHPEIGGPDSITLSGLVLIYGLCKILPDSGALKDEIESFYGIKLGTEPGMLRLLQEADARAALSPTIQDGIADLDKMDISREAFAAAREEGELAS